MADSAEDAICPTCGYPMSLHTLHTRVTDYRGALVPLDDVLRYDLGQTICPRPSQPLPDESTNVAGRDDA